MFDNKTWQGVGMEDKKNELQLEVPQSVVETGQSEEQLQDVTELFEEPAPLSREQILEASRKENKNGDERERQSYIKANSFAFSIGLFFAGIIILVSSLVEGKFPVNVLLITTAMQAAQAFIVARGVRKIKKFYLSQCILFSVLTVCFLVLWILQLCGIWLN